MNIIEEDRKNVHAKAYYQFIKVANRVEASIKTGLKAFDLTHAQLNVLYQLEETYPGKTNPGTLKKKLLVNNPDLTRLIDRLVSKGWVNRETSPENRRKVDLSISQKGREVFRSAHNAAKTEVNDFFKSDLSDDEARNLFVILSKIKI